ncbi:MAG: sulfite exporter TauE/SafE family protein [Burkholderiales bacterium]|nr:sulfite exporter TauE/SafE family protein [Burkholderiales bacterium]
MIPEHLGLIVILFCAYLIRGAAGFGSGLIAMPLLALSYPLSFAVPLVLALDLLASFMLTRVRKNLVSWSEIRCLLPFGLAGALTGVLLLVQSDSRILLTLLGVLTLVVGVSNIRGNPLKKPITRVWAVPAGLAGGCAGALFGTGAPPYIMYLSRRMPDKSMLRATFSWIFLIEGSFRITLFAASGLLQQRSTLIAIGFGMIPMAAGLYAGNALHKRVSNHDMHKVIATILICSGASLLIKTFI